MSIMSDRDIQLQELAHQLAAMNPQERAVLVGYLEPRAREALRLAICDEEFPWSFPFNQRQAKKEREK